MLCAFADQTFLPGCVQKRKASRVAMRCRSAEHRDRRTDHAWDTPGAGLRCERISREKRLLIAYDPTRDSPACGDDPVAPDTAHPSAQVEHAHNGSEVHHWPPSMWRKTRRAGRAALRCRPNAAASRCAPNSRSTASAWICVVQKNCLHPNLGCVKSIPTRD